MSSLDSQPFLFFVMWDTKQNTQQKRCRIWVVRTPHDTEFRAIAQRWYDQKAQGIIGSDNFQLHPPRNLDHNIFKSTCGNLQYPLLFEAHVVCGRYTVQFFEENILINGLCMLPQD